MERLYRPVRIEIRWPRYRSPQQRPHLVERIGVILARRATTPRPFARSARRPGSPSRRSTTSTGARKASTARSWMARSSDFRRRHRARARRRRAPLRDSSSASPAPTSTRRPRAAATWCASSSASSTTRRRSAPADRFPPLLRRRRGPHRAGGGRGRRARRARARARPTAHALFMGALGEALCGYLIVGPARAHARARGRARRHRHRRLAIAGERTRMTRLGRSLLVLCRSRPAPRAEPLSRAEAVARALERNPDVQRSLAGPRLLRGRGTRGAGRRAARAERLRHGQRYRDPACSTAAASTPSRPSCATALRPRPAEPLRRHRAAQADALELQARQGDPRGEAGRARWARSRCARARQAIALRAVRAYNDYLLDLEKVRGGGEGGRARSENHLEMAQNRRAAGVATELDVLRFEVDLENARASSCACAGAAEQARGDAQRGHAAARSTRPSSRPTRSSSCDETAEPRGGRREATASRPEVKAAALNERIYDERDRHRTRRRCAPPRLRRRLRLVRAPAGELLRERLHAWNAGVTLTVPVFDGCRTAGQGRPGAGRARPGRRRTASPSRTASASRPSRRVDRLTVATSVLRAAELNVAQARSARSEMTQANYQLRRGHARSTCSTPRPRSPWPRAPRGGPLRPRQRARRPALRDGPRSARRPRRRLPTPRIDARTDDDPKPARCSPRCRSPPPACGGAAADASAAPGARGVPVRTATVEPRDLDERSSSPAPCGRAPRCSSWRRCRRGCCTSLRDEGARVARGRDAGRARRDRLPPDATSAPRRRWRWPRPTAAHALAEKERADSLLKTGGITDKDRLSAQVSLQVAEASRGPGARRRRPSPRQQLARTEIRAPFAGRVAQRHADAGAMLARGHAASSPSWTTPCSSSAPRCPRPLRQGAAWAPPSRCTVDALAGRP